MKLPNADRAQVPEEKLRDYVLSRDHTTGHFKAQFFAGLGFSPATGTVFVIDFSSWPSEKMPSEAQLRNMAGNTLFPVLW